MSSDVEMLDQVLKCIARAASSNFIGASDRKRALIVIKVWAEQALSQEKSEG